MLINDVFYLLDTTISKLFPEITKKLLFSKDDRNALKKENVVFHLEDKNWLIQYISLNFQSISKGAIKKYVYESVFLENSIHEYQLQVARFIINDLNVTSKGYLKIDNDLILENVETDYALRKSLSDTFNYLGFSYERSEEAIEVYAQNWRSPRMRLLFYNAYAGNAVLVARETYTPFDLYFRDNWLKLKEYDYYKKHKNSVDKYGEATSSMLMSDEEAEEMKSKIIEMSEKRYAEMEFYKENMTLKSSSLKVLKKI